MDSRKRNVGSFQNCTASKKIVPPKNLPCPLPRQNTRRNPVSDGAAVPGRIEFQRGGEHLPDFRRGQQRHLELGSKEAAGGVPLPGESGQKGPCLERGNQSGGLDVHAGELYVGEKSGSVVKNRAVAVNAVFLEDSDVVEMPVVVTEQRIHLKEQCQIPGEVRKARIVCRDFCQVGDPAFVAGEPHQLVPQGHSQTSAQQVVQRDDGLAFFQKIGTNATCPLLPMDTQSFHTVAKKGEWSVALDIAPLQKLGDHSFRQGFIPKLVQLVPAIRASVVPIFLISLGGCLSNFLI